MDDELELLKLRLRLLELETGETQDTAVGTISKYEEPSIAETFSQFTDNAMNAATFGLSNYARAAGKKVGAEAVDALSDEDTALGFQEYLQKERNRREAFRQNYPKASIGAEAIGAFANPVAATIGRGIIGQTPHVTRGGKIGGMWKPPRVTYRGDPAPVGQQIIKGAKGGATIGAAQSIGEQTRPDLKALEDVAAQTGAGTVIGGALPGGFALLQGAWRMGKSAFMRTWLGPKNMQTTLAHRKMVEALEADYPGKSLDEIEALILDKGPEAALMDAGPNSQGLLFVVRAKGKESRTAVDEFVDKRQEGSRYPAGHEKEEQMIPGSGMSGRVSKHLSDLEGPKFEPHPSGPQVTKHYEAGFKENQYVESDVLDELVRRPSGKKALKEAIEIMGDEGKRAGKVDPALTALWHEVEGTATPGGKGIARGLKLETWDYVKKGLDDMYERAQGKGDGPTAGRINRIRKDLLKELDEVTVGTEYAQGRALFSSEASQVDANSLGLQFMRRNNKSDDIIARVEKMSPEDQFAFRKGVIEAIREKIGDQNNRVDITKSIFEIRNLEEKIIAAFGNNKEFSKYVKFLKNERDMFNTRFYAKGSSLTGDRAEIIKQYEGDPGRIAQGGQDILTGDNLKKVRGLYNVVGGIKDKIMVPEDATRQLAKTLMSRSVKPLKETFKKHKTKELTRAQLSRLLTQGLAGHDYTPDPRLKLSLKLRR